MRYEFLSHPEKSGWYIVTDTKWMLVCEFERQKFNETQTFVNHGCLPQDNADKIATAMRELGDWLFAHHYSEIFPTPTYEVRLSEDDSELHIIRHKEPRMNAIFQTNNMKDIADALAKGAEFVRKIHNGK